VLTQVVQRGPGGAAALPGWAGAQAGKTGSADNNLNAWFVGYTKDLSTAVWMGSPGLTQKPMTNVGGVTVFGGTYPAMIWGAYMKAVEAGKPAVKFAPPDALTTRGARQLVITGEIAQSERSRSDVSSEEPDDSITSSTSRNRNTDTTDIFGNTSPDGNGNQDDTPRTTRTTRPPRARDLTTLAPP
jgi:penicillin-binding protein 1A